MMGFMNDEQFRRSYQIVIGDEKDIIQGTMLKNVVSWSSKDINPLNIHFDCSNMLSKPEQHRGKIKVENVSYDTAKKILGGKNRTLIFKAGYNENLILMDSGNITSSSLTWQEDNISNLLEINYSSTLLMSNEKKNNLKPTYKQTYRKGMPVKEVLRDMFQHDEKFILYSIFPRHPYILTMMLLSDFVYKNDLWSDVAILINKKNKYVDTSISVRPNTAQKTLEVILDDVDMPGQIPQPLILSKDTGLIGMPTLSSGGHVEMKLLLRPEMGIGDVYMVQTDKITAMVDAVTTNDQKIVNDLKNIMVQTIHHQGEFYGQEWYTTITAKQMNSPDMAFRKEAGVKRGSRE